MKIKPKDLVIRRVTREETDKLVNAYGGCLLYFTLSCECERLLPDRLQMNSSNWQIKKVYFLCAETTLASWLNQSDNIDEFLYSPFFEAVNNIGFTPDDDFDELDKFVQVWDPNEGSLIPPSEDWLCCFIERR